MARGTDATLTIPTPVGLSARGGIARLFGLERSADGRLAREGTGQSGAIRCEWRRGFKALGQTKPGLDAGLKADIAIGARNQSTALLAARPASLWRRTFNEGHARRWAAEYARPGLAGRVLNLHRSGEGPIASVRHADLEHTDIWIRVIGQGRTMAAPGRQLGLGDLQLWAAIRTAPAGPRA